MDVVTNLYTQLLLRDILGYITPGLIVVSAVTIALAGEPKRAIESVRKLPRALLVPLVGVAYAVGVGMQHLTFDYLGIFAYSNLATSNAHIGAIADFNAALGAVDEKTANGWFLQRERLVVLKHLSANALTATVVASVLLMAPRWRRMTGLARFAWLLGLGLLCWGLYVGHVAVRGKQGQLEKEATRQAAEIMTRKLAPPSAAPPTPPVAPPAKEQTGQTPPSGSAAPSAPQGLDMLTRIAHLLAFALVCFVLAFLDQVNIVCSVLAFVDKVTWKTRIGGKKPQEPRKEQEDRAKPPADQGVPPSEPPAPAPPAKS